MHCEDRFCLLTLAGKILQNLGDRQWAGELYEKVADQCLDRYKCEHFLHVVESQTGDKELLKNLHVRLENNLPDAKDLIFLAESVTRRLGDLDWVRKLYKKAVLAQDCQHVKFDLAASVEKHLDDRRWAAKIRHY